MYLLILLASAAFATVPIAPSFPGCGDPETPELCPPDLEEDWELINYIPDRSLGSVREAELELGSGIAANVAFETTTGRWDVILAVADSGVQWHHNDIVNKLYINTGELPPPVCEDGAIAEDHDCDGNGLVNVQDWAFDPRVTMDAGRDEGDDTLDPSDLIYTVWGEEWDGVDNDGNGYIDDISGWDFFGRDNDAWHDWSRSHGTHGTGVMREAAAEGKDLGESSGGSIGVCPNCSILPVRVGDSFVTDGQRAGEAIMFAVDSGAVVVNLAVGALSNPTMTTEAAAYAFDNGALIVGAAGDENAYHHNFPAVLDNAVYVHSIRHNTANDDQEVYSYMNTWNCNNYGSRMTLVAPSGACATGSCAVTTGVIGLIHSAARNMGLSLSAGEVYQLMVQNVDDVHLSAEEINLSRAYPSKEGWDAFYGYGRVNVGRAVESLNAGDIPPLVSIDGPSWYAVFDPAETSEINIEGRISARSGSFTYVVEVGFGNEPDEWTELESGSSSTPIEGVLATFDLRSALTAPVQEADGLEDILGRLERVNQPAVTIRVRATDDDGVQGEMRKVFYVSPDEDIMPGFPVQMGASGESSPVLIDLDDDGILEILIGTADGVVLAIRGDGTAVEGWPVRVDDRLDVHREAAGYSSGDVDPGTGDYFISTVGAGDLDGDGVLEVIGATGWGGIYAWNLDGSRVDGFPYWSIGRTSEEINVNFTYDQGFMGAPSMRDLDGDGTDEIVIGGMDGRLYVVDGTGSDWGPYPIEICFPGSPERDFVDRMCGVMGDRIITSPLIADIDGDGDFEIGLGTNEAVDGGRYSASYMTGTPAPGWPRLDAGLVNEAALLPLVGQGHPASMAAADMDGDGDLEILNPIMLGQTDIFSHDGTVHLELPYHEGDWGVGHNVDLPSVVQMVNNPSFGDLDGDGLPDPIQGGAGALWLASLAMTQHYDFQHAVVAWSGVTGEVLPGWPRQIEDIQFFVAPAVADVSGDGNAEAIYGSGGYMLYAWNGKGEIADGWPKFTGHWILGAPAIGDIDGDGYVDVVISTREGWLFAWSTDGHADQQIGWGSIHHDNQNTGDYSLAIAPQAGPPPIDDEAVKGCSCSAGPPADSSTLAWVVFIALIWGRRRLAPEHFVE
ncbi:MAG: S8 family serine peptidase [Myxococcota bacterium]